MKDASIREKFQPGKCRKDKNDVNSTPLWIDMQLKVLDHYEIKLPQDCPSLLIVKTYEPWWSEFKATLPTAFIDNPPRDSTKKGIKRSAKLPLKKENKKARKSDTKPLTQLLTNVIPSNSYIDLSPPLPNNYIGPSPPTINLSNNQSPSIQLPDTISPTTSFNVIPMQPYQIADYLQDSTQEIEHGLPNTMDDQFNMLQHDPNFVDEFINYVDNNYSNQ